MSGRRDRSWERDDRDRFVGRGYSRGGARHEPRRRDSHSRSRSPPRRGEWDRRGTDRRDYGRDRGDERRSGDRRDTRRESGRDERRDPDTNSDRRGSPRTDRERPKGYDNDRDRDRSHDRLRPRDSQDKSFHTDPSTTPSTAPVKISGIRRDLDPAAILPGDGREDGEAMDADAAADEAEDAAMMAIMGLGGFGSTKGKQVEGNQEGGVNIKKQRTWRQYMNRRGGFNRPLDKIK